MTSDTSSIRPPRIAVWCLGLFTPAEQAESILGDMLEEFSDLASRSGGPFARRWYWRQSIKSIVDLAGAAFREAPWSTAAAVAGGYLLDGFGHRVPDKILGAGTDRYLAYWSTHFGMYKFLATDGMLAANLIASLFVGGVVALAAKGREMVATMTLSLILCAMIAAGYVAALAKHWPMDDAIRWLIWQCAGPLAIVVGGMIVRRRRSTATV